MRHGPADTMRAFDNGGHVKVVVSAIDDALWAWDPAGLADVRKDIPNEYADLASSCASSILNGATVDAALARVEEMLRRDWGIDRVPSADFRTQLVAIAERASRP